MFRSVARELYPPFEKDEVELPGCSFDGVEISTVLDVLTGLFEE